MKIYLKWLEIFGVPIIIAIFSSLWITTNNIVFIIALIFSGFFYFIYLYYLNRERSEDINFVNEQNARKMGYQINNFETTVDVDLMGHFKEKRIVELEVLDGQLFSKDHFYNAMGRETIENIDIKITKIQGNCEVTKRVFQKTPNNISYYAEFSPPLKKGDKVSYEIATSIDNGGIMMTREEIFEYIKKEAWIYREPYQFHGLLQRVPTKNFSIAAVLPKEYRISTYDDFFDVMVEFTGNRHISEYQRLQKNNCFSRLETQDKQILKLQVKDTIMNLSYHIKWIPPHKEDYEKLLSN